VSVGIGALASRSNPAVSAAVDRLLGRLADVATRLGRAPDSWGAVTGLPVKGLDTP